jgi:agmatinase
MAVNPFNINEAIETIQQNALDLTAGGSKLVTLGGDHTIALPLLRAAAQRAGEPVAMLHFDAHLDTWDTYFGAEYTHGTPFRRAVEEGILDTEAISHIGTRGPLYGKKDLDDDHRFGFGIVTSADVYYQGVLETVAKVRDRIGRPPAVHLRGHRRPGPRPRAGHRNAGSRRHHQPRTARASSAASEA